MRPTRLATLVALLVGAGVVTWGALRIEESRGNVPPPLPWAAPLGLLLLGIGVLVSAIALRRRLRGTPGTRPPQPIGVARMAVLGKASSHVGSLLGGVYGGYAVLLVPSLDIDSRRERALVAVIALLAALLLVVAGLLLERTCRVEPPRGDQEPPPGVPGP